MADQQALPAGPDLSKGIAPSEFAGQMLLGHVGDDEVLSRSARIAPIITGRSPKAS
jgi:hypothetical protein